MGTGFSFSKLLNVPTDTRSYDLNVSYDQAGAVIGAQLTVTPDVVGAGGAIGSFIDGDIGPYQIRTTYRNPSPPVRSLELDRLPWSSVSAAWINLGLDITASEKIYTATRVPPALFSTWDWHDSLEPPSQFKLLLQGVRWDGGTPSYTQVGELATAKPTHHGFEQAIPCADVINDYLASCGSGYEGYHFVPACADFMQPPGFDPDFDWMLALHRGTFDRSGLTHDGTDFVGTMKTRSLTFTPPAGGGGVIQCGPLSLPDRARVTYRPVRRGVR